MIWVTEAQRYYRVRLRRTDILLASRVQIQKCWLLMKTRCFHQSQSLVTVATATCYQLQQVIRKTAEPGVEHVTSASG